MARTGTKDRTSGAAQKSVPEAQSRTADPARDAGTSDPFGFPLFNTRGFPKCYPGYAPSLSTKPVFRGLSRSLRGLVYRCRLICNHGPQSRVSSRESGAELVVRRNWIGVPRCLGAPLNNVNAGLLINWKYGRMSFGEGQPLDNITVRPASAPTCS
jgi:hypothetical protein